MAKKSRKMGSERTRYEDDGPAGLAAHLTLARLQTGALTAVAPVAGFLAAAFAADQWVQPRSTFMDPGPQASAIFLILLFAAGLCMHVFGFVLNEVVDLAVDRRAGHHGNKPLVSGRVSRETAVGMVVLGLAGGFLIMGVIRSLYETFEFTAVLALTGAYVFGGLYDVTSKRLPGADAFLGVWAYLFCITGALLVGGPIPAVVHLIGLLGAYQVVFNNAVEGGIKDADTDRESGVDNIAVRTGVGTEGKWLHLPPGFRAFAWSVKGLTVFSIALFFLAASPLTGGFGIGFTSAEIAAYHDLWYDRFDFFLVSFILTLALLMLVLTAGAFLVREQLFKRKRMFRAFSRHEILTYSLVPVVLLPLVGWSWSVFLLFLPVVWFVVFNYVMYGSALQPRV